MGIVQSLVWSCATESLSPVIAVANLRCGNQERSETSRFFLDLNRLRLNSTVNSTGAHLLQPGLFESQETEPMVVLSPCGHVLCAARLPLLGPFGILALRLRGSLCAFLPRAGNHGIKWQFLYIGAHFCGCLNKSPIINDFSWKLPSRARSVLVAKSQESCNLNRDGDRCPFCRRPVCCVSDGLFLD